MAGSVRCCMKLNLGLLRKNVTRHVALNNITQRTLFTKRSLGLTAYLNMRDQYKHQFLNLEDSFRNKMSVYVENDATGMIFTEDLKVMLHLVEETPSDKELIVKMLKKYNAQSSAMRFGTYVFGPIVMRACHNLNDCELALKLFNDPDLLLFFNQLTSYQIILDLLYRNKKYREMMTIYNGMQEKLIEGRKHPRNALILVTAACYKENSPDSYTYALNVWRNLHHRGYPIVRRVITHVSALALKQNEPYAALEILTMAKKPRYIAIRCLKVKAFTDINRLDDILPFFRSSLENDEPNVKKEAYFKDAIEAVEAAIKRNNVGPDAEIVKLLALIKNSDLVQPETMEDHIDTEIEVVPQLHLQRSNNDRTHQTPVTITGPTFIRRPGLRDLV